MYVVKVHFFVPIISVVVVIVVVVAPHFDRQQLEYL